MHVFGDLVGSQLHRPDSTDTTDMIDRAVVGQGPQPVRQPIADMVGALDETLAFDDVEIGHPSRA